ncbi:3-isopropylmalate/(R)-2-methylmalate dehydratase small subunit [Roseivivax lentus]|uniref:3-isopropylmalate dehydratase n=1 Tax=Roseivivax lentus TaxID=633194 RepID=A0A1N7KWQ4_9RHOB|nr:3-isopropylmalate dehydratase small subunit [Roseivivax lentus]SIS66025.1 3-isopropylmalate/(R)-2-methylmalate dehydratase small subunit [Roseivivax lentus]
MAGWTTHEGMAVALPRADIDTDQLIPARFMSASRSEGYGQYLMRDLREGDGDFPLDRHPEASMLIAGPNFGCGSSREAAVYALVDAGIRVVIAESFADIFAGNAVNNGLLPARVADTPEILAAMGDGTAQVTVDLEAAELRVNGKAHAFDLPRLWAEKLINGWDDIDLTRAHLDTIAAFRAARQERHPWAWPRTT